MVFKVRVIIIGLLIFFNSLQHAQAVELSNDRLKKIQGLIKLEYRFAAAKKNNLIILGGDWYEKRKYQHFFGNNTLDYKRAINQKKLLNQIAGLYKKGYQILFRKELKFYKIGKNKFIPMRQIGNLNEKKLTKKEKEKKKKIRKKEIRDELISMSQCVFCQFRFSLNYVSIEGDTQYSGEVDWQPYFKIEDKYGFGLSLGATTYSVENDDLEQVLSYGFKFQGVGRYYLKNYFFDAGLGQHYFAEYGESSLMYSVGAGYIFTKKHWLVNEKTHMSGVFINMSKINWRLDITEIQFGVGVSF